MTSASAAVVKLSPRALDAGAIHAAGEQVLRIVREGGHRYLHLDLGSVQSVCSSGLGGLVALHREVQSRGGHLTLFNVSELVFRILDVSRLTRVFEVRRLGEGGPADRVPAEG
jgi:anti-anti-sigma factor